MATIYIHIGYPKCFSTTLQRSYFEQHPSVYFGGVGKGDNISYADDIIELCFESLLKYAGNPYWLKMRSHVSEHLNALIANKKGRKIVFSGEHLSMNFSFQGIENELKYERLNQLFHGHKIKILVVRRDPVSLLRSLYGEYVRMGYNETYKTFLKWVLVFQDRNFLSDLNFTLKNEQLTKFFGGENIHWLDYETVKADGVEQTLNKKVSGWLGTEDYFLPIENDNPSLGSTELAALLKWNKAHPRGLSLAQTEPFERHRARLQYEYSGLEFEESDIFSNVIAKRKALAELKKEVNCEPTDFEEAADLEKMILQAIEKYSK